MDFQQQAAPIHPKLQKKIFVIALIMLLLLVAGGIYALTAKRTSTSQDMADHMSMSHSSSIYPTVPVNQTPKKARITIQNDYYLDVTVPKGYAVKEGFDNYANIIVDANGKALIGFQKSGGSPGTSPTYPITVNTVPLVIEQRKDIGCPAMIYSKASNAQQLAFGIITWCDDPMLDKQLPVYKEVIDSIVFGPKLKEVLLGTAEAPTISTTPTPQKKN